MSTIKVTNINNASASSGGIALDSSGHVQVDGVQMPTAGALSNRNLIINGAMNVSQRGTSFSFAHDGTTTGYTIDRISFLASNTESFDGTVTQSTDAPEGFTKSWKLTTGTAEASIDADDLVYVQTALEGQDLQRLKYGLSSAQTVTISFYVKSSVTGTYGFTLYQGDAVRNRTATYTINTANTWEYKTITMTGDTAGTINDDNGPGLNIAWNLAAGSSWNTTDSTDWGAYVQARWAYGHAQNGVITTASATWQITGVQLEVGEKATPYEHRSYGDELARSQRYYYRHADGSKSSTHPVMNGLWYSVSSVYGALHFPVEMRALPSIEYSSNGNTSAFRVWGPGVQCNTEDIGIQQLGTTCVVPYFFNISPSGTAGQASWIEINNDAGVHLSFSAEL